MPKTHKTFFGKTIGVAWDSIKTFSDKIWNDANHDALEWSVLTTQALKEALKSGIVSWVVNATQTNVDNAIVDFANKQIPKLLADLLLLKGIQKSENESDIEAVAQQVMESYGIMSDDDKAEFYSRFGAKLYILWEQHKSGKKVTFGQGVELLEKAYREYLRTKK